jgi:hypothetical protein
MPISDSSSEKHLSTRTAAATEDKRELLDAVGMSSLEIRSVVVFIVMEREAPVVALELQVLSYLNSFMLNTVHHKRKVSRPRYAS